MARIDVCWNGKAAPITITQGAATADIGLSLDADGWYACTEVVCARIQTALEAAFPASSWWVYRKVSNDAFVLDCLTAPFDASIQSGFAWWADINTSYSGVTEIASTGTPPHFYNDQWFAVTLPVRYWHREIAGRGSPVVWDSHWAWDLRWTRRAPDEVLIRQMRTPFALYFGDADDWAVDDRDGYIVCRLADRDLQRGLLAQDSDAHGVWPMRCIWLNPTL